MDNKKIKSEQIYNSMGNQPILPYLNILNRLTTYGNQHTEAFIIDQLVDQALKDDVNLVGSSPDIESWASEHLFSCLNTEIEELSNCEYSLEAIEKPAVLSLLLFDSFPPEFIEEINKEFGSKNWFRDFAYDTNLLINEENGNITTQYVLQKYKGIIIERMREKSPIWNTLSLISIRNICQQEKFKDNLAMLNIAKQAQVFIKELEPNMSKLFVFQYADDLGSASEGFNPWDIDSKYWKPTKTLRYNTFNKLLDNEVLERLKSDPEDEMSLEPNYERFVSFIDGDEGLVSMIKDLIPKYPWNDGQTYHYHYLIKEVNAKLVGIFEEEINHLSIEEKEIFNNPTALSILALAIEQDEYSPILIKRILAYLEKIDPNTPNIVYELEKMGLLDYDSLSADRPMIYFNPKYKRMIAEWIKELPNKRRQAIYSAYNYFSDGLYLNKPESEPSIGDRQAEESFAKIRNAVYIYHNSSNNVLDYLDPICHS